MHDELDVFREICGRAPNFTDGSSEPASNRHPFDRRNLAAQLSGKTKELFDNGHYSESVFEALKLFDQRIARISGITDTGRGLMMAAFSKNKPKIQLNSLMSETQTNEQEGYMFITAGMMSAIRNPRGHEAEYYDDVDSCLDYLTLVSLCIRKIEHAGISF